MSWLNEVSQSFLLQQETLFLALSLFDRFMSLSYQVWQSAGSCSPTCALPVVLCIEPIFLHVVPTQSLQVIAVACASLASKQCVVKTSHLSNLVQICSPPNSTFLLVQLHAVPPSCWAEIPLNAFSVTVLMQIEGLVITTLKWTCMTPSVYTFLHLYCHAHCDCPAQTIALASYLMVSIRVFMT
jgi:hypothetical protein